MKWHKMARRKLVRESEDEEARLLDILKEAYQKLERAHSFLLRSNDIELRKKYMRPLVDFLNWMDYEI